MCHREGGTGVVSMRRGGILPGGLLHAGARGESFIVKKGQRKGPSPPGEGGGGLSRPVKGRGHAELPDDRKTSEQWGSPKQEQEG